MLWGTELSVYVVPTTFILRLPFFHPWMCLGWLLDPSFSNVIIFVAVGFCVPLPFDLTVLRFGGGIEKCATTKLIRLRGPHQYTKYTKCTNVTKRKWYTNARIIKHRLCCFLNFPKLHKFEILKTCVLLFVVQIRGWDGSYQIEETKLVCAISRIFNWET